MGIVYAEVFIWDLTENMQKYVKGCDDCKGYAHTNLWVNHIEPDKSTAVYLPKKFGEIHLVLNDFGVGTAVHEITHIVLNYISAIGYDILNDQELICDIVGKANTEFWNEFYDRFTHTDDITDYVLGGQR